MDTKNIINYQVRNQVDIQVRNQVDIQVDIHLNQYKF